MKKTEKRKQANKKTYVTINDEGIDFRKISKIMTSLGMPLNHATARNQLLSGMKKLLKDTSHQLSGKTLSDEQVNTLIDRKDIHDAFNDIIYLVFNKQQKESLSSINKKL